MKTKRKGSVPAHLRPYLFKKGQRTAKRKRRINPSGRKLYAIFNGYLGQGMTADRAFERLRREHTLTPYQIAQVSRLYYNRDSRSRRRRKKNPIRDMYRIIAKKGRLQLWFNGRGRFTNHGISRWFTTQAAAESMARSLLKRFPALRKWAVYVEPVVRGK